MIRCFATMLRLLVPARSLMLVIVVFWFNTAPDAAKRVAAAEPITLRVEPANVTVVVGGEVTLNLSVAAGNQPVDGVQTMIGYPTDLLEVVGVVGGATYATVLINQVDAARGTVEFGAGRGQAQAAPSGTFILASIRFRGKMTGVAPVRIVGPSEAAYEGIIVPVTPHDGAVTVQAVAGGNSTLTPTPNPSTPTPTASTVNTATGGTVVANGVTVTVAASAAPETPTLTVDLAAATMPNATRLPEGWYPAGAVFNLTLTDASGSAVNSFTPPVRVEVLLRDSDLRLAGGDPTRLQLHHYETAMGSWLPLTTSMDDGRRSVQSTTGETGLFALLVDLPVATGAQPADATLAEMETVLTWTNPLHTAQFQIQVVPFNQDGPAINLIIGREDLVRAARFQVPPPVMGRGPYILLPGMTYAWRVRVSPLAVALGEHGPGWSAYAGGVFRTPSPSRGTIAPVVPPSGSSVATLTPTLHWANTNPHIFYYEVQLSADPAFNDDPMTAAAAVYWNLVHGGLTDPPNSWAVPADFPLESGTNYFWRVRPRVQGDGIPAGWSEPSSFTSP